MTSGPNIGRRRQHQRRGDVHQHIHHHVHHHGGNRKMIVHQAPPALLPPAPTRPLVPTMNTLINAPNKVYAPSRTYAPVKVQSYSPAVYPVQQREDDGFGAFLGCALGGLALFAALMGGGGGGGPRR